MDSTLSGSSYTNQWVWDSTLARSTSILESAVRPEKASAQCLSTSTIFSMVVGSMREEVTRFSTASTTPSAVTTPIAVEPSLMASMAYSTWKRRPSGEKVLTLRSYSERVRNILTKEPTLTKIRAGYVLQIFCLCF